MVLFSAPASDTVFADGVVLTFSNARTSGMASKFSGNYFLTIFSSAAPLVTAVVFGSSKNSSILVSMRSFSKIKNYDLA